MEIDEILPRKYMILLEIAGGDYRTLDQIAEKVGITKQGVHEYMKRMREEGLIETSGGQYRVTMRGVEKIFSYLNNLDKYLKEKKEKLNMMEYSAAIAGEDIKKGEKVYLFMEKGHLHAYKRRRGEAKAIAAENALKGEDVAIKNITGLIKLSPGKIHLFSLPSIKDGGSKRVDMEKLKKIMEGIEADKRGAMDVVGKTVLKKMNLKEDFEFCAIHTAIEMAQRGLNVILMGEGKEIKYAISKIEEYNRNAIEEIEYEVHDFSS